MIESTPEGNPPCHVTSKADHVTIKEVEKCEYLVTFEKVDNNENNVVINHCSNSLTEIITCKHLITIFT